MSRTTLLSAIAVTIVFIIPNILRGRSALVYGIGPTILIVLLYLAAYFPAVRRACAGRTRGILPAALVAGIDVSATAALLVGAFQVASRIHLPIRRGDLQSIAIFVAFSMFGILIIGILFACFVGLVISIKRASQPNSGETPALSPFAGRRWASYIPLAACILIITAASLFGLL